ncbi:YkyA family protein [Bacillus massiliigorillae]|uniref:YkyA family protein n=1 Tax=Bacillus massiliigorillae TaxID=1243664 RepID=UPI00039A5405|nr:YkyA family protein [Bacillus massiliigorillae]
MKKYYMIIVALVALTLTGCSNYGEKYLEQHKEIVSQVLKNTNQNVLFGELNVEEQQLYKIILDEGKDSIANVAKQMASAVSVVSKSQKMIDEEKVKIVEQKEQFNEIEKTLKKLKDTKEDKRIKHLHETYLERMDAYEKVLNKYDELLSKKSGLYGLLQNGKQLKAISAAVDEVNTLSIDVEARVNEFNEATKAYNETLNNL